MGSMCCHALHLSLRWFVLGLVLYANPVMAADNFMLEGKYINPSTISHVTADGIQVSVDIRNRVSVVIDNKDTIGFIIDTMGQDLHECHMAGSASKQKTHYVYREKLEKIAKNCRLSLSFSENSVEVHDIGGNCRLQYCGAKAYLDGVFQRKHP